ncbi:Hypothetical predicted protein, partial [Paramuricea clavata]
TEIETKILELKKSEENVGEIEKNIEFKRVTLEYIIKIGDNGETFIRQFLVNEHGQITKLDIRIVIGQYPITFFDMDKNCQSLLRLQAKIAVKIASVNRPLEAIQGLGVSKPEYEEAKEILKSKYGGQRRQLAGLYGPARSYGSFTKYLLVIKLTDRDWLKEEQGAWEMTTKGDCAQDRSETVGQSDRYGYTGGGCPHIREQAIYTEEENAALTQVKESLSYNANTHRCTVGRYAKTDGISLNDVIYAGPKLQQELFDVLIRFRRNPVAF